MESLTQGEYWDETAAAPEHYVWDGGGEAVLPVLPLLVDVRPVRRLNNQHIRPARKRVHTVH